MKLYILFFLTMLTLTAQDMKKGDLPYAEIPKTPEKYTATSVASRMIDGLGFRYYWATEGLRTEDLEYKFHEDGRTSEETIAHIYDLSKVLLNATTRTPNGTSEKDTLSFDEIRKATLLNLKKQV